MSQLPILEMLDDNDAPTPLRVIPIIANTATGWLPGVRHVTITGYPMAGYPPLWEVLAECNGEIYGMSLSASGGASPCLVDAFGETLEAAMEHLRGRLRLRYMAVDVSPYTGKTLDTPRWRPVQDAICVSEVTP